MFKTSQLDDSPLDRGMVLWYHHNTAKLTTVRFLMRLRVTRDDGMLLSCRCEGAEPVPRCKQVVPAVFLPASQTQPGVCRPQPGSSHGAGTQEYRDMTGGLHIIIVL